VSDPELRFNSGIGREFPARARAMTNVSDGNSYPTSFERDRARISGRASAMSKVSDGNSYPTPLGKA
jgi:hypothetical protein